MTAGWPVRLVHDRVELRPIRGRDGAAWTVLRRRNEAWLRPWDSTRPPRSTDEPASYTQMVRNLRRQARRGAMLPWGIWYTDPGGPAQLVGQLTVAGIQLGSARSASIGYWVDERVAGRGIVPTAVALACDHCWQVLGLHRIEVSIRPENTKSLRVVEKLGFRVEGIRPKFLHIDGRWRDHVVFALNEDEVPPGGLLRRYLHTRAERISSSQEPLDPAHSDPQQTS